MFRPQNGHMPESADEFADQGLEERSPRDSVGGLSGVRLGCLRERANHADLGAQVLLIDWAGELDQQSAAALPDEGDPPDVVPADGAATETQASPGPERSFT